MRLSEIFSNWEQIRKEMIDGVKPLTQVQIDWLPAGGKNSIADLLRHISETEVWWFGKVVLNRVEYEDLTKEMAPDIESILKELQKSHQYVLEALSSATTDDWDDRKFSYRPERVMSLKQIAWHTIEHEMRHRGQIFMLMRLQGINPPKV